MLVRQKTLKRWGEKARKAKGKAPASKGDLRHYTNEGSGGKQHPREREENGDTIIFTLSHCTQHMIVTEFHVMS